MQNKTVAILTDDDGKHIFKNKAVGLFVVSLPTPRATLTKFEKHKY